jgi:hypothetical protein
VSHQVIADALASGRIEPCGPSGPLAPETIGGLCNPVAQMGTGPLVEALDNGADVVVCGRACDTAVFAALPIWRGHDPGLALHCAKIAECGTLCADPPGANDSVLCRLYADAFEVGPLNPARRCTPGSVAGHSLYEQPDPHCFHEPEGEIDLRGCRFEQVTDRAVRVRGSVLRPVSELWIKLESAELKGYRAVTIAGVSDPTAIREIDALQDGVRKAVAANLDGEVGEGEYRLVFRRYGLDAVALSPCEAERLPREGERLPGEIGLLIEVIAPSQDLADGILGLARATALHQSYEGRKTTAGNLAFPFSPSDLSGGPVYAFGLYHLMRVEGTEDLFPITYMDT